MLRTLYAFISKGLLRFALWAPYFIFCASDDGTIRSQSRHLLQQLANAYYIGLPGWLAKLLFAPGDRALTFSLETLLKSDETLPMLLFFLAVHSNFSALNPDSLSASLRQSSMAVIRHDHAADSWHAGLESSSSTSK